MIDLDHGLQLEALSSSLLASFPVVARRNARVLWMNERWFMAEGVAVHRPEVRAQVDKWLLDNFAVAAPDASDPPELYSGPAGQLGADRYGGSQGTIHGGSGRCGVRGGFNVKGIGRTPLLSGDSDWYHSHGCLWLEEAMREAICAEVADAELPHGAVRAVAVIDAGTRIHWGDGNEGERRALLVRPNFIRLAHMQRSIFFGDAGSPSSDQALDAKRTAEMVQAVWGRNGDDGPGSQRLAASIGHLGEQLGASYAARLWLGPFYPSNVSVEGRTADFGSFRSVRDWRRTQGAAREKPFGDDRQAVRHAVTSLASYMEKYGAGRVDSRAIFEKFDGAVRGGFEDVLDSVLGQSEEAVEAKALLRAIYSAQQREVRSTPQEGPRGSLATQLRNPPQHGPFRELYPRIRQLLEGATDQQVRSGLKRLFRSRPLLDRERLVQLCLNTTKDEGRYASSGFPDVISHFINEVVGRSRRLWPRLAEGLMAVESHYASHSGYVLAQSSTGQGMTLHCEAVVCGGKIVFYGEEIDPDQIPNLGIDSDTGHAWFNADFAGPGPALFRRAMIGDKAIVLPSAQVFY